MGGRGSALRSKQKVLKEKKEKQKAPKLQKDPATGVYKGERMQVDQADNHNANPSYHGGVEGRAEYTANKRAADQAFHAYLDTLRDKLSGSQGMKRAAETAFDKNATAVGKMRQIAKANKAYSINCQRSVIAYEMRRRGYLVEAESNSGKRGDIGYKEFNSLIRSRSEMIVLPRRTTKRPATVDQELLKGLQPGQHGIISWGWRGGKNGHTINVERTAKGLLYVDAQTGRKAKTMGKYLGKKLLGMIDQYGFTFMRSDNKEFDIQRLVKK
ncbi:hypothetical protein lacNasYZ03_11550 [Lactobacillus nasalidis]|uniref:Tox-PL domain-containing protein n=1 Tax=Lactobacillus nasalidis TaxID=2797258 RepID=A0ABQ3W604_9LACO|nr:toxin glutamine deamidase domain-containing protein [Lactobacillus nasalidis]GHV97879.1 hypothetical protein lacNasYZ01_10610 [Lactobacillus nasalidis]GHW00109.1 hypothetical protein lacNasYZ02_15380 [Lactobacillus nasalidis]GHW01468.1 hypothetical protein lacNasYZ03_11550 [Lactobacillus nasalidis]